MTTLLKTSFGSLFPFSNRRFSIHYRGQPFDNVLYSAPTRVAADRAMSFAKIFDVRGDIMMPDVRKSKGTIAPKISFKRRRGDQFLDGVETDGVQITLGDAAIFSTRDCPTVVMCHPDGHHAVAAHASRESLIGDFQYMDGHELGQSVISAMVNRFSSSDREYLEVAVVLSIGAEHFEHSPHHETCGEKNRKMIHFVSTRYGLDCFDDFRAGKLSLFRLIRAQCARFHIDPARVHSDGFDTYSTKLMAHDGSEGKYAFYSNRRGDSNGYGNLVLVKASEI